MKMKCSDSTENKLKPWKRQHGIQLITKKRDFWSDPEIDEILHILSQFQFIFKVNVLKCVVMRHALDSHGKYAGKIVQK